MRHLRFSEATRHYRLAKDVVIGETNRVLDGQPLLKGTWVSQVGQNALTDWRENWVDNPARHEVCRHWDWTCIVKDDPRSLFLAIWRTDDRLNTLAAMTVGKNDVTVRFLEADPGPDALRAGFSSVIASEVATRLARALSRKRIVFNRPLSEELVHHYCERLGFTLEKKNDRVYCWKDV